MTFQPHAILGTAQAGAYFCKQASGSTEIRDTTCKTSSGQTELARAGNYAAANTGVDYGQSRSPEVRSALSSTVEWIARTKSQSRAARAQRASSMRKIRGYRDRIRDRELPTRANEIRDDIKRAGGSGVCNSGKEWALGDQLQAVEHERFYDWKSRLGIEL